MVNCTENINDTNCTDFPEPFSKREITEQVLNELESTNLIVIGIVELYFDDGTLRFCTTPHNLNLYGYTYIGLGNLATIEAIPEDTEIQSTGLSITLSGVNVALIQLALDQEYQGRKAVVKLGLFNNYYVIIDDPVVIFSGRMDYMNISLGKESAISLILESRLADWERTKVVRYNSADHRQDNPTDASFDFVEQMIEKQLPWGSRA